MQRPRLAKVFGDKEDPRRRLAELFGQSSTNGGPPLAAREWAHTVLEAAQIENNDGGQQFAAVRALRKAEPRLTAKTATYLAQHMAH